eukprot:576285-Amphidinium_carterae.2
MGPVGTLGTQCSVASEVLGANPHITSMQALPTQQLTPVPSDHQAMDEDEEEGFPRDEEEQEMSPNFDGEEEMGSAEEGEPEGEDVLTE